jgi:hypothetical protein
MIQARRAVNPAGQTPGQAGWRHAMLVAGTTVIYKVVGESVVHCERCGGDRPFKRRSGRRWLRVLYIPVYPLAATGEHLRCTVCRTTYRVELLGVPTLSQMQTALLDGTKAAVLEVLRAGDPASRAARKRALDLISAAGAPEYAEDGLAADLAGPGSASGGDAETGDGSGLPEADAVPYLQRAVEGLAFQLEPHAREWFLSNVVRVGLADGPLSAQERGTIGVVARYLGISQSRAEDVIVLAEEAAQAG